MLLGFMLGRFMLLLCELGVSVLIELILGEQFSVLMCGWQGSVICLFQYMFCLLILILCMSLGRFCVSSVVSEVLLSVLNCGIIVQVLCGFGLCGVIVLMCIVIMLFFLVFLIMIGLFCGFMKGIFSRCEGRFCLVLMVFLNVLCVLMMMWLLGCMCSMGLVQGLIVQWYLFCFVLVSWCMLGVWFCVRLWVCMMDRLSQVMGLFLVVVNVWCWCVELNLWCVWLLL